MYTYMLTTTRQAAMPANKRPNSPILCDEDSLRSPILSNEDSKPSEILFHEDRTQGPILSNEDNFSLFLNLFSAP